MAATNKFCPLYLVPEEKRIEMDLSARNKNEIDHVLIDASSLLKDVSAVLFFNTGSGHACWMQEYIIPPVEKRVLNISRRRRRPTQVDEREIMRQIGQPTGWLQQTMKKTTGASPKSCFSTRKKPNVFSPDGWIRESTKELLQNRRVTKRNNIRNVEYFFLCGLTRRKIFVPYY